MDGPRTPLGLKYQLEQERFSFNRDQIWKLERDRTGVYALWVPDGGPDECLYVGMSETCVRRRLLEHLNREANPELRNLLRLYRETVEFSIAFTGDEDETLTLEDEIIKAWKPVTNRKGLKKEASNQNRPKPSRFRAKGQQDV